MATFSANAPCMFHAFKLHVAILLRLVYCVLASAVMGKRPGRGHLAKKKQKSEAQYLLRHPDRAHSAGVGDSSFKPRRLSVFNEEDCKFAVKFADGVNKEISKVRDHQIKLNANKEKVEEDDVKERTNSLRSPFGFFGKSTFLIEAIRPRKGGTPHLSIQLGVPGSGKSTFLIEFLTDVYNGVYSNITGSGPSLLLASVTNAQCKMLFALVKTAAAQTDSRIPDPIWCVSEGYRQKSILAEDVFTLKHASDKHHRPQKMQIYVCTHDYAAERYTGQCLHRTISLADSLNIPFLVSMLYSRIPFQKLFQLKPLPSYFFVLCCLSCFFFMQRFTLQQFLHF